MPFIKDVSNEYGTPIKVFNCEECGEDFSVCPSPDINKYQDWRWCLSETCSSYDPSRDADILFMSNEEISKEKRLVSIRKLIERKAIKSGS